MKLIVQIPCFDEEQTLPAVIRDIPRQGPGIVKLFALCGVLTFLYFFFFIDQAMLPVQSLIAAAIPLLAGFPRLLTGTIAKGPK